MTRQSSLSFARPAFHSHDPVTSRQALAHADRTGSRHRHLDLVLAAVREHPGLTAREIAGRMPFDLTETRRRLTDLKIIEQVRQGPIKRVGGHRQEVTWSAT